LLVLGGIFLGFHFASWITSLEYTSVASSVVLVTTAPLWVALSCPALLEGKTHAIGDGGFGYCPGRQCDRHLEHFMPGTGVPADLHGNG